MTWVYLSPHLDDAAYSCGGLIAQQTAQGDAVSIWTICAGDPPSAPLSDFAHSLHTRWQTGPEAIAVRREEDVCASRVLGADWRHFSLPDCIYRRDSQSGAALYASEEAIFGEIAPAEHALVSRLAEQISAELPAQARLVVPLSLGGHVDHRLVLAAARRAAALRGAASWYYADFPYVLTAHPQLQLLVRLGWQRQAFPLLTAAVGAWVLAAGCHQSQLSTFWKDEAEMASVFQAYAGSPPRAFLWRPGGDGPS